MQVSNGRDGKFKQSAHGEADDAIPRQHYGRAGEVRSRSRRWTAQTAVAPQKTTATRKYGVEGYREGP
jgi:hypothetical protein